MERAWRMRWVAVAIAISAVFVGGPGAGDLAYEITRDEQAANWAYLASVAAHFAAFMALVGWPVTRFWLTRRES